MLMNSGTPNLNEKIVKEERGSFHCPAFNCCIFEQNVYTLEPSKVNVRTFQVRIYDATEFLETDIDLLIYSIIIIDIDIFLEI